MVQGAWGVIPVHLLELSPASIRTFVVGTSYQLGNLISSASSTIEATLGEDFPLPPGEDGKARYDYGKVMAIFMGAVFVYVAFIVLVGPEKLGRDLSEVEEEEEESVGGKVVDAEKGNVQQVEKAV